MFILIAIGSSWPVVSDTSFESGLSDDYAIPPDALSYDATTCDASMPSLLVRASYADSPRRTESLEKIGHLTKLGGKLKVILCFRWILRIYLYEWTWLNFLWLFCSFQLVDECIFCFVMNVSKISQNYFTVLNTIY